MRAMISILFAGGVMTTPVLIQADSSKPSGQASTQRPSEHFRAEHQEMKKHLSHVDQWVGSLSATTPREQVKTMMKIVVFFKEHIEPHAKWEEKALYPAVDKRASQGAEIFTKTMRYEHKIIGRWIDELEKEAKDKRPNTTRFARKTDRLLGLIDAHFEEEEEVLLPILDKSMSPAEFAKEIPLRHHQGESAKE